ncbi:MAG: PA2778 family cysteine peptidase [Acidiferrobacteraceae bacterium]
MRGFGRKGWIGAALILLGGCATIPAHIRRLAKTPPFDHTVEIASVPFFPQTRHECGPASLAMMLDFAGRHVTPGALEPKVYLPGRHGSLAAELVAATWREDLLPYVLRPRLVDLLREVAAGHPVLVLQNLSFDWYPDWHYAVVVGFNLRRGLIMLHSGKDPRDIISVRLFERVWARSHRWAMIVLRPGEMPETVRPSRYLRAVWGLERLHHLRAALKGYRAAMRRWPGNLDAEMGSGNVLYALGHKRQAAAVFRHAAVAHASAAAFNNLAQALASLHCYAASCAAAREAVAVGHDRRALYERTRLAVCSATKHRPRIRCLLPGDAAGERHESAGPPRAHIR